MSIQSTTSEGEDNKDEEEEEEEKIQFHLENPIFSFSVFEFFMNEIKLYDA